jgi:hypothetical protein
MAAVTPQTILCGIERLSPAGSAVEAATSQSRKNVTCKRWTAQWDKETRVLKDKTTKMKQKNKFKK